jgi:hypothetical protein
VFTTGTLGILNGQVYIKNTGLTNAAKYKVLGSLDGGTTYDITIKAETVLNANTVATVENLTKPYTNVKVQAASNVAATPTTVYASLTGVCA